MGDRGTCDRQNPQETTRNCLQTEVGKGGGHSHGKLRKTQAHGARRRDERRKLSDGGSGRRTGGRRFALGEEVGSRCNARGLR